MTRFLTLFTLLSAATAAPALAQDEKKPGDAPPAASKPAEPAKDQPPASGDPMHPHFKIETGMGDIVLELDAEKAPFTVDNFAKYVEAGFYNGTVFHRVIPSFMIQGGGYTPDLREKKDGLRPPIQNEGRNGLKNERGTIAMARTNDPDSATAQFFINVKDNTQLDATQMHDGYAVFGKVVQGMDVVDKIKEVKTKPDPRIGGEPTPEEPVVIKSISLVGPYDKARVEAKVNEAKIAREKELADFIEKTEKETGKKFETTPTGLKYIVLQPGSGAEAKSGDEVEVRYTGWLVNGQMFDTSEKGEKKPLSLVIDSKDPMKRVIAGWNQALTGMKVGEKRKLVVPASLAYGSRKRGMIPADATLVFDVELVNIKSQQPAPAPTPTPVPPPPGKP